MDDLFILKSNGEKCVIKELEQMILLYEQPH